MNVEKDSESVTVAGVIGGGHVDDLKPRKITCQFTEHEGVIVKLKHGRIAIWIDLNKDGNLETSVFRVFNQIEEPQCQDEKNLVGRIVVRL